MEDSFHRWPTSSSVLWSRFFGHKVLVVENFWTRTLFASAAERKFVIYRSTLLKQVSEGDACSAIFWSQSWNMQASGRTVLCRCVPVLTPEVRFDGLVDFC